MAAIVIGLATSTFSVLRGQAKDPYGDMADVDNAVYTNIPGSVQEQRTTTITFAAGRPQQVRFLIGRLPPSTDVKPGDRLKDERTGEIFIIDGITQGKSPMLNSGVRLDLRRVT